LEWVNILEEPMLSDSEVVWKDVGGNIEVDLNMRGFEIKTLKVVL
jgi:hypothetical protein